MKEIKYLFLSQVTAILFLLGIAIGSTVQEKVIVYLPSPVLCPPTIVEERAMSFRGTLGCHYDEKARAWLFIDKQGRPCKVFMDVSK